jgi:hypothetical protein
LKNLSSHVETLSGFIKQLDQGFMQADIVESLSTNLLVTFQAIVNQIFKENNLESVSENRDDEKMNCVIRQFGKM